MSLRPDRQHVGGLVPLCLCRVFPFSRCSWVHLPPALKRFIFGVYGLLSCVLKICAGVGGKFVQKVLPNLCRCRLLFVRNVPQRVPFFYNSAPKIKIVHLSAFTAFPVVLSDAFNFCFSYCPPFRFIWRASSSWRLFVFSAFCVPGLLLFLCFSTPALFCGFLTFPFSLCGFAHEIIVCPCGLYGSVSLALSVKPSQQFVYRFRRSSANACDSIAPFWFILCRPLQIVKSYGMTSART